MSINLVNRFVPPSELVYKSNSFFFTMSPDIDFAGWSMARKDVITGYSESLLEEDNRTKTILIPQTMFIVDFHRRGFRNISLLVFPLFLIFIFGLLSLSFDPAENPTAISALATGAIASTLSFRFVMESLTPKVGYFVFSDQLFLALLLISILEFIFGILLVQIKYLNKFLIIARGSLFLFASQSLYLLGIISSIVRLHEREPMLISLLQFFLVLALSNCCQAQEKKQAANMFNSIESIHQFADTHDEYPPITNKN